MPVTIRSTNPKIMDDNIFKLDEAIKAADVFANPEGTAEETLLTTIGINGKKYDIGASAENVSYSAGVSVKDKLDTKSSIHLITGLTTPQAAEGAIYEGFTDDIVLGVYVFSSNQYRNVDFAQGETGTIYTLNLSATYQNKPCIICSAKLS